MPGRGREGRGPVPVAALRPEPAHLVQQQQRRLRRAGPGFLQKSDPQAAANTSSGTRAAGQGI
eukprot:9978080-Lingulodinium_polyedra.AAC.1